MNNYYHRGQGECVELTGILPSSMLALESYISSLPVTAYCSPELPVGWLGDVVEEYQHYSLLYPIKNNYDWYSVQKDKFETAPTDLRRIFLIPIEAMGITKHPVIGINPAVTFTKAELFDFAKKIIFSYENSGNPAGDLIPDCDTVVNDVFKQSAPLETYQQEAERMYPLESEEGVYVVRNLWQRGSRTAHITARQMGQKELEEAKAEVERLKEKVRKLREGLGKIDAISFHKNEWTDMANIGEIVKQLLSETTD